MNKSSIYNIIHHADVSEKEIECYLCRRTKEHGWPCLKYSNPNMIGYPDRLIVLPSGNVVWVELKSLRRRPSRIQLARIGELRRIGHRVEVIDSKAGIDELINSLTL